MSRSRSRPRRCRSSPPARASRRPSRASSTLAAHEAAGSGPVGDHVADRLAATVAERRSQVVLGLDPDPARLWPAGDAAGQAADGAPAVRAATAVAAHCRAVLDAVAPAVVAVKLQVACFERLGAPGWQALHDAAAHARALGLLVVADAKRGDIDVSAAAYAQGLLSATPTPFGDVEGLGADLLTVSPYMGADTLQPFVDAARPRGAGLFVLVRTSNPGAADVEDARLQSGEAVWEHVARMVDGAGEPGPQSGLHDVGAVVGATAPEHLARARELLPRAVFLLPGVGAQGGRVEDLAPAWAPGRAAGLVTASRSIVRAHEQTGGDHAAAARAEAERLRDEAWSLA
ncbi:orotidine-5'-phosphate decarboxylase [Conexibacter sp. SYSU D00693]|uniref:orotidine-5'-phosphate decarboxylase n=1 Tax=Conexibacter sp. SYSU D00693 TaxID=2812560 RepID=UPI00196A964B|nr:orotidine-5'-phosphate decarboxylase [Conexibacter sp. SYSU D00693]